MTPSAPTTFDAQSAATVQPFDQSVLHEIFIEVAPTDWDKLDNSWDERVPCEFTFDGAKLSNVGIRKKGLIGSASPLIKKPAFSVKFDDYVKGQALGELDKIILNNAIQDESFLSESLGYELIRRAGLFAPKTAHAVVVLNGRALGLFVVKEAIERGFLGRTFGEGEDRGNLYEGSLQDFVRQATKVELKHEKEENLSRDDIIALADAIDNTTEAEFEAAVAQRMDLPAIIRYVAMEGAITHWDGYSFSGNNYYLYHLPKADKFVFIAHGMDQLFGIGFPGVYKRDATISPIARSVGVGSTGRLAERLLRFTAFRDRFLAEWHGLQNGAWNVPELLALTDKTATALRTSKYKDARLSEDLARFEKNLPAIKAYLEARPKFLATFAWP